MMTEKDIRKLLSDRNKGKVDGLIITRPLSDTVDYAKVWEHGVASICNSKNTPADPLTGYLIRDKGNQYWAAILVDTNLKWYVLPQYRKGNIFPDALREIIVPHILQHKPVQRLILNFAEYSAKEFSYIKKTALSAGFKITRSNGNEIKMAIEAASLGKREYISGKNTGLSEKRKEEMKTEISLFIRKLSIFETEIELKTGDIEYIEDIREVAEGMDRLCLNLTD